MTTVVLMEDILEISTGAKSSAPTLLKYLNIGVDVLFVTGIEIVDVAIVAFTYDGGFPVGVATAL